MCELRLTPRHPARRCRLSDQASHAPAASAATQLGLFGCCSQVELSLDIRYASSAGGRVVSCILACAVIPFTITVLPSPRLMPSLPTQQSTGCLPWHPPRLQGHHRPPGPCQSASGWAARSSFRSANRAPIGWWQTWAGRRRAGRPAQDLPAQGRRCIALVKQGLMQLPTA